MAVLWGFDMSQESDAVQSSWLLVLRCGVMVLGQYPACLGMLCGRGGVPKTVIFLWCGAMVFGHKILLFCQRWQFPKSCGSMAITENVKMHRCRFCGAVLWCSDKMSALF